MSNENKRKSKGAKPMSLLVVKEKKKKKKFSFYQRQPFGFEYHWQERWKRRQGLLGKHYTKDPSMSVQ